ncbi:MAG: ATP-dependent DNA helicase RuvA [Planctomycetes bacterium]|nr:ATP-dependent DNA helicase RuvA [Planctomycetota bacterium]
MITKMTGVLTRCRHDEDDVRLQVGPIEYQILVPEAVRRQIQLRTGQEMTFHITEYLEGNSSGNRFVPRRVGFLHEHELEFFELFCTVEKIGVKKALKAMAFSVKTIADAISRQDSKWLSALPGIGPTTAEQIVTTLKRKVTPFIMLSAQPAPAAEPVAPNAVVEEKSNGKKGKAAKKAEPEPTAPEPLVTAADGKLIEDVYEALMGLGHNPIEARAKLDALLMCGKPFRSMQEAITLIYSTKG